MARRILRDVLLCVSMSAVFVTLVVLIAPERDRTWNHWKLGFGACAAIAILSSLMVLWVDERLKDRFAPMMSVAARRLGLVFERDPMRSGLWMTGQLGLHPVRVHLAQGGTDRFGPHVGVTFEPHGRSSKTITSLAVPASARDIVEMVERAVAEFEETQPISAS